MGASAYGPLTPDLFGGVLVGVACVYVARPLLHEARVRWVATLLAFVFVVGGAVCDGIWYVEGGSRGTSWLWRTPVVGLAATACAGLVGLLGAPFEVWPGARLAGGGLFALAAAVFSATLPRGHRRIGVALSLAGALLLLLLPGWASFIAD